MTVASPRRFPAGPGRAAGSQPRAGGGRRLTLLVFPHAGAGASAYRGWGPLLAPDLDVLPLQLPGREDRWSEPPRRTIQSVLAATWQQWGPACRPPYAVFGHSVGALAAFELVREIRREGIAEPSHLIVSGRVAPHIRGTRRAVHDLPAEKLAAHLRALGGIPPAVLADRAFQAMLLPVLRADLACDEDYEYIAEPPLRTPVTVLSGTSDPLVWPDGLDAWAAQTTGPCVVRLFSGGHFSVTQNRAQLLACVRGALGLTAARDVPSA